MTKVEDVSVCVHNFFLMKHVVDDGDGLVVVGTFIQHAFSGPNDELKLDDLRFGYRFNDETADEDSGLVKHRRTEKHETNMGTLHRHTFQVRAPLEVSVELDYFPFKVVSAKLLVELSTFTTEDSKTLLRPNLIVHKSDKPNMFCVQKDQLVPSEGSILEQAKDKMDKAETFDFISPFPKVSYLYDTNKKYCPKFMLKFLMVEDGMKRFVEIVFPMFLIAGMNTIHVLNPDEEQDVVDYLANSATFALSVLVFLPTMVGSSRRQNLYTANNLYIMFIFLALLLSSIPQGLVVDNNVFALMGLALYWASFLFPLVNGYRYLKFISFAKKDANENHFWPHANKNPYKVSKDDAEDSFIKVEDIVYMDESARTEMEYTLRKVHKFQILEFARTSAKRESGLREASVFAS
jgi:hypothetical protein